MSTIKDYKVLDLLGKGGFARVYRAKTLQDNQEVAIKMIEIKLIHKNNLKSRVQKEIEIHSRLKHPSIVEVYTYFEDKDYVYLVMEICKGGPLQNYITQYGRVSEMKARHFLKQIVNGLVYLHSYGILHRDLTLANILMINKDDVKIGDFGLATRIESGSTHKTMCGTPNFMSPEVVTRDSQSLESDVWSVGCMLYTMLVGCAPFDTREVRSTLDRVVHCEYQLPHYLSREAADLISSMLKRKPEERIALQAILNHPFILNRSSTIRPQSFSNDSGIDSILSSNTSHSLSHNSEQRRSMSASRRSVDTECRRARSHSATNQAGDWSSRHRESTSLSPTFRNKSAHQNTTGKSSQLCLSPITTDRLRPLRQSMKNCIFSILADGRVCLEVVKSRRGTDLVVEVMLIDPSTSRIVIYEPNKGRGSPPLSEQPVEVGADSVVHTYSLDTLPDRKRKVYNYCAHVVNVIKKQTPKVSIFTNRGKCSLMETGHDSLLVLNNLSNIKVEYSAQTGITKILESDQSVVTSSDKSLHCLSENHQELMQYTMRCYRHCKKVESLVEELASDSPGMRSVFPVTMGSRQLSKDNRPQNEPIMTLLPDQVNNGSQLISQPNSCYSVTSAPSQYNQRTSPPLSRQATNQHHNSDTKRGSLSNIELPLSNSTRTTTNQTINSSPVFVPDVGWASKISEKRLKINFNDGTVLCVDYDRHGLEMIVYTDSNGLSRNYDSQHSIPHEVNCKLRCLDKVVRALRQHNL